MGFFRVILKYLREARGNATWDAIRQWIWPVMVTSFTGIVGWLKHAPLWQVVVLIVITFIIVTLIVRFFPKSKHDGKMQSDLEIEPVPTDLIPARRHPCKILIRNKNLTQNADDLKVELVALTDDLSNEQAHYYHPPFPLVLKADSNVETINPNDSLTFTVFSVEMASKIQDRVQKFTARFFLGNHQQTNQPQYKYAPFHEGETYWIKFAASARGHGFARIEREINVEFFNEGDICKIELTPLVPLTSDEKRCAEKAVEKLSVFAERCASRISWIKGQDIMKYDPEKDDDSHAVAHEVHAYILCNLTQKAAQKFDTGIASVHGHMMPKVPMQGSTMYEERQWVMLEKLRLRISNLKNIVDKIQIYIK
jgi:hypothetical protein